MFHVFHLFVFGIIQNFTMSGHLGERQNAAPNCINPLGSLCFVNEEHYLQIKCAKKMKCCTFSQQVEYLRVPSSSISSHQHTHSHVLISTGVLSLIGLCFSSRLLFPPPAPPLLSPPLCPSAKRSNHRMEKSW